MSVSTITAVVFVLLLGEIVNAATTAAAAASPVSTATTLLNALSTVAYEFVILMSFFLSWVAFRSARKHRAERDAASKKKFASYAGNERFVQERGTSAISSRNAAAATADGAGGPRSKAEVEKTAARIMAMSTEQYTRALRMYRDLVRTKEDRLI